MCISSLWVVPNGRVVVLCGWSDGRCSVLVLRVDDTEIKVLLQLLLIWWPYGDPERWTPLLFFIHQEGGGDTTCSSIMRSSWTIQGYKDQLFQGIIYSKRNVMCHYILSSTISYIYLYSYCSSHHSVSYFLLYTLITQLKYCKNN